MKKQADCQLAPLRDPLPTSGLPVNFETPEKTQTHFIEEPGEKSLHLKGCTLDAQRRRQ
jgi:hypothetical protein